MKTKYIYTLCIMLSVVLGLSSCLKGEDEKDYSQYDDMAITSFAISAINKYTTKKTSAGKDTITMTKLSAGFPVFTIDHYKQQIYNRVPLSVGCDLKHVLASIVSKNSGTVLLKSMNSDSLFYYSSTDSVDFSQPREIRVYALNGSGYRAYTVTMNKQESENDEITWSEYAAGSPEIPTALYQDITLQRSALEGDEGDMFQLSKDGGSTWTNELLGEGEDASLLPESHIAWVSFPYAANEDTDYEIMAGSISIDDTACTVWRKIMEKGKGALPARWVNIPTADSGKYFLPKMDLLSLVWFNSGLYAIGNNGYIYKSRDGGITWKESDDISLPTDRESNNLKAATDQDGSLWLLNIDSGRVWKGTK